MKTKEIIDRYYEFANAGKWEEWCDLFDENLVMDEQLAGHIEGLGTLRPMMGGMKKMYSVFTNIPDKIVVSDEEAAVVSHIYAASPSGKVIEAKVMNYFKIKAGKIAYMANFHDSRPFAPVLEKDENAEKIQPKQTVSAFPVIHRFMGRFMQLPNDHVNAYIVELENALVIVDTTLALSSANELRGKALAFGKPIEAVLLTHGHPDHYTGLVAFHDVPAYASQGCLEFALQEDLVKAPTATGFLGDDYPKKRRFPENIVRNGDSLTFDGVKFTFYDLGPGESPSDGMWVTEKNGAKQVFIGDTISLNCHCFFRDGYAREWNQILERLTNEFDDAALFYIGHGDSPVGKEAIDWQLGYNKAFLHAVDSISQKTVPVSKENQDKVLAAMKRYLPVDSTFFLLEFEIDKAISLHFPNRGYGLGQGKQFYFEHMMLLGSGKFDEAVLLHYAPDASIVTFDGIHYGREAIKEYIIDTFRRHKTVRSVTMEYFAESSDVIIFRAKVVSEGRGTITAQDAFYMENGKIKRHIALTLVPDADYEKIGTKWMESAVN